MAEAAPPLRPRIPFLRRRSQSVPDLGACTTSPLHTSAATTAPAGLCALPPLVSPTGLPGRPALPRGASLSAANLSFHLPPRTPSSPSSGAAVQATRSVPCRGYVRFSVEGAREVPITPYSRIYGEHPKSFHFDRSGEKVPAGRQHANNRENLARVAARAYLGLPAEADDQDEECRGEQKSVLGGSKAKAEHQRRPSKGPLVPPPSPRAVRPVSPAMLEALCAGEQQHRKSRRRTSRGGSNCAASGTVACPAIAGQPVAVAADGGTAVPAPPPEQDLALLATLLTATAASPTKGGSRGGSRPRKGHESGAVQAKDIFRAALTIVDDTERRRRKALEGQPRQSVRVTPSLPNPSALEPQLHPDATLVVSAAPPLFLS